MDATQPSGFVFRTKLSKHFQGKQDSVDHVADTWIYGTEPRKLPNSSRQDTDVNTLNYSKKPSAICRKYKSSIVLQFMPYRWSILSKNLQKSRAAKNFLPKYCDACDSELPSTCFAVCAIQCNHQKMHFQRQVWSKLKENLAKIWRSAF